MKLLKTAKRLTAFLVFSTIALLATTVGAAELIKYSPDAAWATIWPAVLANRDFGRA